MPRGARFQNSEALTGDEVELDPAEAIELIEAEDSAPAWIVSTQERVACDVVEISGNKIFAEIDGITIRVPRSKLMVRE